MRFRRKHNSCLNCHYPLDKLYNYCPVCGQENTDANIPFHKLVGDFLSNYFALDSRFGKTVTPFFVKPGFLTNEFMEGRRASYAHPIRIYLVVSLIFFAIFSFAAANYISENQNMDLISAEGSELKKIEGLPDSTRLKLADVLNISTIEQLNDAVEQNDLKDLKLQLHLLSDNQKEEIVNNLSVEEVALLTYSSDDSSNSGLNSLEFILQQEKDSLITGKGGSGVTRFFSNHYFSRIDSLADIDEYTADQVVDSLQLRSTSDFEFYITKQLVRVNRAGNETMLSYIIKNLSIMMLILIPVFALLLKLLYIRKNVYYLKHLIHALHLHSFIYLITGICIILIVYFLGETAGNITIVITMLVITVYAYFSFLRVYKQKWFKTLIKFLIVGFSYSLLVIFFSLGELFISFLIY